MLFSAVRNAASDEPSRVTTFYEQHEPLTTAVNEAKQVMGSAKGSEVADALAVLRGAFAQ